MLIYWLVALLVVTNLVTAGAVVALRLANLSLIAENHRLFEVTAQLRGWRSEEGEI